MIIPIQNVDKNENLHSVDVGLIFPLQRRAILSTQKQGSKSLEVNLKARKLKCYN